MRPSVKRGYPKGFPANTKKVIGGLSVLFLCGEMAFPLVAARRLRVSLNMLLIYVADFFRWQGISAVSAKRDGSHDGLANFKFR